MSSVLEWYFQIFCCLLFWGHDHYHLCRYQGCSFLLPAIPVQSQPTATNTLSGEIKMKHVMQGHRFLEMVNFVSLIFVCVKGKSVFKSMIWKLEGKIFQIDLCLYRESLNFLRITHHLSDSIFKECRCRLPLPFLLKLVQEYFLQSWKSFCNKTNKKITRFFYSFLSRNS